MTKSFDIPKELVWEAYLKVKAGADGQSLSVFDERLCDKSYLIL